jgi:dCTP diphosphatase
MTDLRQIQKRVFKFRDERNWKVHHQPKNCLVGLFVESGELAEHFQYLHEENLGQKLKGKRDDIGEELVDVLYWTIIIGHAFGLDVAREFCRKMKSNLVANSAKGFSELKMDIPEAEYILENMTSLIQQFRKLRGWGEKNHPQDILLKLMEEIGELARHVQFKSDEEFTEHLRQNKNAVADEVIDILICTLLLFDVLKYDISNEFDRKMIKNTKKYPVK